jgi:Glycosyl hydrolases family 16
MRRLLVGGTIAASTLLMGVVPTGAAVAASPQPDPPAPAPATPGQSAGYGTSAAAIHGWGEPNRVEEFDGPLGDSWNVYDSPGHAGNGRRTPDAVSIEDGILTITGDSDGNTAGMAWNPGQRYGRWEGRVRAPASDESYNALLLLWPDAEDFPVGGEIDFMEMMDHTRQTTDIFLHNGEDDDTVNGEVRIDATQWHNWAVEWTPTRRPRRCRDRGSPRAGRIPGRRRCRRGAGWWIGRCVRAGG